MKRVRIGLKSLRTVILSQEPSQGAGGQGKMGKQQLEETGKGQESRREVPEAGKEKAPCSAGKETPGRTAKEQAQEKGG